MAIAANEILASRYRAETLLGKGGMGEVWRCYDLAEQRHVAIKTVLCLSNPNLKRLFQVEVIAVARLRHGGIVQIYDLLRHELMARQLWVDALWRSGQRERARAEARAVRNEAAHRALRQTVSITELQAAFWAFEENDWERVRTHREAAGTWGGDPSW